MGEIAFFTSNSYPSSNTNGKKMSAYDMTLKPSLSAVRSFLATDFSNKAAVSLSELFTPYTTNSESLNYMPLAKFDDRPRFYLVTTVTSGVTSAPVTVYTNPGSGDARQEVLAVDLESGVNYGICPTFSGDAQIYDKDDATNINSIAFRAPMMVAGFGYTTEGMPYPNLLDQRIADLSGTYSPTADESGYAKYQFADNVKNRPDLWKSGPLDTRWDDGKKMHVAAPEMFLGYALCDIPAASGRWAPSIGNYPSFTSGEIECAIGKYDKFTVPSGSTDGGLTSFPTHKLLIINRSISMDISSGSLVIATRLNNGEYFPIFVDCSADVM